jgi:hypothetical protein
MRLDSSGRLGLGTSAPQSLLDVGAGSTSAPTYKGRIRIGAADAQSISSNSGLEFLAATFGSGFGYRLGTYDLGAGNVPFVFESRLNSASWTERLRVDSSGNLGIGTTSPGGTLDIKAAASTAPLIVQGPSSEFARIDSSGRLLVGTSTSILTGAGGAGSIQVNGPNGLVIRRTTADAGSVNLVLGKSRSTTDGSYSIVFNNDTIGDIRFAADDGTDLVTQAASIKAEVDGTPGADDMPGRLVFSTTADGASSPTERLRITSAGVLQVADAGNITVGTTTGTKIGTATTQKLGFYNATPVVQPAAVADATTAIDVITQLNALLAKLRTLGIIAT